MLPSATSRPDGGSASWFALPAPNAAWSERETAATSVSEQRRDDRRAAYERLEDRLLVLAFQAGNEADAFDEIHRRYSGLARRICYHILRNPDDAEEATQEAMLRVYQGLRRLNGRYMVRPWVARIATNVSLDAFRAQQRRLVADGSIKEVDLQADLAEVGPEVVLESRLDRERVERVLAILPDRHRQALVMRAVEGRSHRDIARAMGMSPPQAKALIHRARASFRRAWSQRSERRRAASRRAER